MHPPYTREKTIMLARERRISNIHPQSNANILVRERNINVALLTIGLLEQLKIEN